MRLVKLLRGVLIVVIAVGGVAIVWNLMSRHEPTEMVPSIQILDPQVSRHSTEFEYSERKRGRVVFKVYADVSTETINGLHQLKDVELIHYDQLGQPVDTISGQEAIYRKKAKLVEFFGNVQVGLADGTRIFSKRVNADLGREVMTIEDEFLFEKRKLRGKGNSMFYDIPKQEIEIVEGMEVEYLSDVSDIRVKGRKAIYKLDLQAIEFTGKAEMSDSKSRLDSEQITVFMGEDGLAQKMLSEGHSQLNLSSSRTFSGRNINIFFKAGSDNVRYFEILGEEFDESAQRASYVEYLNGVKRNVDADSIVVYPLARSKKSQVSLREFVAQGNVRMVFPDLGVGRSQKMEVLFFEDGQRFRQINLQGEVEVVNQIDGVEQKVFCTRLHVQLHPDQSLGNIKALGNVKVRMEDLVKTRSLSAKDWIEVEYDKGLLEYIVAEGDVVLDSQEEGKVESMASEHLKVLYEEGLMEKAIQSGNFRFLRSDPIKIALESERAVFSPKTEMIEITGKDAPVLKIGGSEGLCETIADKFSLNQETGHIWAFGNVKSLLHGKGEPTVITSERMQVVPESGWIEYLSNPRMVYNSNFVTGKTIKYNPQERKLVAEDEVESIFSGEDEDGMGKYRVTANHLLYQNEERRALYEGQVEVNMQDFMVIAPSVEFISELNNSSERLKEVIAWGGVRITGESREAEGERAVHFVSQGKVIMTGDPAWVVEPGQGKISGRTLTFFTGDERFLVEGMEQRIR